LGQDQTRQADANEAEELALAISDRPVAEHDRD
jgi:hypothetical protein